MSRFGALVSRITGTNTPVSANPDSFDPAGDMEVGDILRLQIRRPIMTGLVLVLVLVFGLFLWAALASISNAVIAPGVVKVENNSKTLRSREGGVVRKIFVHEGERVRAGQPLIQFDRAQSQASVDIYQAQYDSALANMARFQAEASNASSVTFPAELLARQADPRVAALIASQRGLFESRMMLYRSQAMILSGQAAQLGTQIAGLQAQVASADAQQATIAEELSGVRELEQQGYAPKTRRLGLERGAAGIKGQRGSLTADIGRARQSIGEIRMQIAQLEERRQTDAATGLRDAQDKLTDAAPKLRATSSSLVETVVRAPVDGYVFNLSQYTEGGVAQPSEVLLQIVPINVPLLVTAHVPTTSITDVRVGLPAEVTLSAYNPRTTKPVDGTVVLVGADAQVDEATKSTFYLAQIRVDPTSLARAGADVRLSPGMPAQVSIVTGKRTILDYLLAPFTDAMRTAMRER